MNFKNLFRSCLLLIGFTFSYTQVLAIQTPATTPPQGLIHVGVIMEMPFAQNIDGHYSGIAVDIWEKIAKLYHWKYIYIPLGNNGESNIDLLAASPNIDIIIGPISVSETRLEKVDFTRPFYLSSIGVIIKKHEVGLNDILRMLLSKNLLHVILILIGAFALYLTLLWLFERNQVKLGIRPESYHYPTITQRIWLHLFQKKVDYMPITAQGRIIGIFWIIFAAAIFTAINANFTSALTIARYENNHLTATLAGLQSARVAGVIGQLNVDIAEKNGIEVTKVANIDQAINLLKTNKVDGVVCDTPVGSNYLRRKGYTNLILSQATLENDEIAFAVKLDSPIRHLIDIGITSIQDDDSVVALCRRYIGDEAEHCDL